MLQCKEPVKLIEWVKIALLFLHVCVKTVPVYDFKLVWVVLHPSLKEFLKRFINKSKITMSSVKKIRDHPACHSSRRVIKE